MKRARRSNPRLECDPMIIAKLNPSDSPQKQYLAGPSGFPEADAQACARRGDNFPFDSRSPADVDIIFQLDFSTWQSISALFRVLETHIEQIATHLKSIASSPANPLSAGANSQTNSPRISQTLFLGQTPSCRPPQRTRVKPFQIPSRTRFTTSGLHLSPNPDRATSRHPRGAPACAPQTTTTWGLRTEENPGVRRGGM
jgi:hypothetical protein